ncbi:hypothetical protein [Halosolutus halophilus]|uniref:hypothetical protein n=1 Tax=Halosolutus halophilus TaxID=1552990 RepID=UPI002235114E|nr:hypothetical protein [Halosolutus halophilus]
MNARKLLAVTVVLMMLASGGAFAMAPAGAVADQHEDDEVQEPTEDGVDDSQLQVTVEDATIVLLTEDSEMADEAPADVANNESAVDGDQEGVTVLETSIEVTVEQASILNVGDQSTDAAADANGVDSDDTTDDDSESDDAADSQELSVQEATIFVVVEDGDDQSADANGVEDGQAMDFQEATVFVLVEDAGEMLDDQPIGMEDDATEDNESDAVDAEDNESDAIDDGDELDENASEVENGEDGLQVTIEEATIFIVFEDGDDQAAEEPIAEDDEPVVDDNETDVDDNETDVDDNETVVDDNETVVDDNESEVDDNATQDDDAEAAVSTSCSCTG